MALLHPNKQARPDDLLPLIECVANHLVIAFLIIGNDKSDNLESQIAIFLLLLRPLSDCKAPHSMSGARNQLRPLPVRQINICNILLLILPIAI